ncbi:probable protein tesmin/TSO1-like CXC 3 at N-terminal half [Coccomyxa sp. Obi]|nr:probable protein tesmin/TSO1-like CXC 3 at N-terminal half [Coccomyxa sp. Obi]
MQGPSLQRTPERPGRGKRGLLEAASPFSLFAKELPPITPPRNQWDSSSTFPGCPGFTGLSPAMPGFTTPKLATETTPIPHEGTSLRDKGAGPGIVRLKDQQQGAQATANVSFFSPPDASRAESPDHWQLDNTKSEHQAHRHRLHSSRDREAAKGPPMKSEASGDQECRDIRHTRAQPGGHSTAQLACDVEEHNSMLTGIEPDAKADLLQRSQTAAHGWETKLHSAGRTWQYGQLKSPPESSSFHLPSASLTSHHDNRNQQSTATAPTSLTSPALKAVMAGGGRVDHRVQGAVAVAALSAAAAATPVSRRLSSSSSGQGDSVVPPTTPGDEAKTKSVVSEQPKRCNCKKSRCLKLYCDCFAAGQYCKHACSCQSCLNNADNKDIVVSMRDQVRQRNPQAFQEKIEKQVNGPGSGVSGLHKRGCHCKKSHCKKKYCECFQAGVNCGVHCKCDECHNTVEDGLPPPPRPSGKQSAAAVVPAVVTNPTDRNKTSPGTPPPLGKETSFLDARRTSARSVKRKAWVSSGGAQAQSERPHRLTPVTDSSASQLGPPSSGMLSPPDMVWPANTLAQAQGHVLGSLGSAAQVLTSPPLFDNSRISRILGRTALEQVAQLHQVHGEGVDSASRLLSVPRGGLQEGLEAPSMPRFSRHMDGEAPAEARMEAEQCTDASNLQGKQAPAQAMFPFPLPAPISRMITGGERPSSDQVMGRICDEATLRSKATTDVKDSRYGCDRGAPGSVTSQGSGPRIHDSTPLRRRHLISAATGCPSGVAALPRTRQTEFSLEDMAAAEEALCSATPWTEQHAVIPHRAGGRAADMDVERLMLGSEEFTQPLKALQEQAESITFKAEDPMHMDQARMKRGLWLGQQVGRKKGSHAKNSKVRKLTNAPKLADNGSRTGIPQRSSSLPAPCASIPGIDAALMRSHSTADDAAAELLSPTAPASYGQGQMLRMGAGRTFISPKHLRIPLETSACLRSTLNLLPNKNSGIF